MKKKPMLFPMNPLDQLLRENIRRLIPYSSARTEYSGREAVYFDANENPFNSPFNRYPDPLQSDLKKGISAVKGIHPDKIFIGNGSDEAIDLLIRAFCVPGTDQIVIPEPTYGMYEVCAAINDVIIKKILLKPDFNLDAEQILNSVNDKTKMIFLCSPNNPTGNSFADSDIQTILANFNGITVMDEAYIDFAPHKGFLNLLDKYPKLVILQTFSKAWGMAGVRLGIAFAEKKLIEVLNKIKYPYNVSILAQKMVLKMLERKAEMHMWVKSILQQRQIMVEKLKKLSFVRKVYPSDANFLLVKVDDPKALYGYLEASKLIVRNRSKMPLCYGCLRITIGSEIENKMLIDKMLIYDNKTNTSGQ